VYQLRPKVSASRVSVAPQGVCFTCISCVPRRQPHGSRTVLVASLGLCFMYVIHNDLNPQDRPGSEPAVQRGSPHHTHPHIHPHHTHTTHTPHPTHTPHHTYTHTHTHTLTHHTHTTPPHTHTTPHTPPHTPHTTQRLRFRHFR
jgi:hypothetical protein